MKKHSVVLLAAIALVQSVAFSQKPKSTIKAKATAKTGATQRSAPGIKKLVIKDTLAYNIQTTLNELNSYIRDNKQPIQVLVGSYKESNRWSNSFASLITVPTSVENSFVKFGVDRYKGVEIWQWKSILLRAPKDKLPVETFTSLRSKVDSIINAMPQIAASDEKNKITKISTYENVSDAQYRNLYNADEMMIKVDFVKPITQTEQQSIDSLAKIYRPGLGDPTTAGAASEKFTIALANEGFSDEKRDMIFADEVKVAADKNIRAAYEMLVGTSIKPIPTHLSKLAEGQKAEIRKMAEAVVKAYNAQWEPKVPASTTQPTSTTSSLNQPQTQQQQPQGRRVKCSVCNGVGQYEKVTYSHTYDGIYNKVQTNVTKWVVCDVCGGSGWVTKYKKN